MEQSEFKTKWIEALTNGTFFQTQNVLQGDAQRDHQGNHLDDDVIEGTTGYCCLGVAIALTSGDANVDDADGEMPSQQWCAKWGIYYSDAERLASLNDAGSTFDQIAEEIGNLEFRPYDLEDLFDGADD